MRLIVTFSKFYFSLEVWLALVREIQVQIIVPFFYVVPPSKGSLFVLLPLEHLHIKLSVLLIFFLCGFDQ